MTYNKPNALHTVTVTTDTAESFDFMLLFFFAPEPNKS